MNVKISTKEIFTVITPQETLIPANMTGEFKELLLSYLRKDNPHLVLNLSMVSKIEDDVATMIVSVQQEFYENKSSFVVCEIQKPVETFFDEKGLLELMNTTPTESEAGDILQMEEMERDLMDDEEIDL